jgi:hypothetical protein
MEIERREMVNLHEANSALSAMTFARLPGILLVDQILSAWQQAGAWKQAKGTKHVEK